MSIFVNLPARPESEKTEHAHDFSMQQYATVVWPGLCETLEIV